MTNINFLVITTVHQKQNKTNQNTVPLVFSCMSATDNLIFLVTKAEIHLDFSISLISTINLSANSTGLIFKI